MRAINLTIGLVLVLLVSACSSSRLAGPGIYYDDIYYVQGVTRENMNQAFSPVPAISKDIEKAENNDFAQQQREYQNSLKSGEKDNRDFTAIQEEYASLLGNENTQELDTLIYYDDETGYWVDGFDGSSMDRDYAERMMRFHGTFIRIPYYSPLYSEVVYFNNYDWNVYVDGNYAYAFPTWTNRWYNSFHYNSWGYPGWSMGMSWGYPYNNYWGMGYNYYDPFFYSSYYPYWHRSYYNNPYYYGGGGYYSGISSKPSNRTVYSGMRTGSSSNTRPIANTTTNSREILKTSSGERLDVTNSGTRITRDQQGNTTYESKNGTVYTRSSRGGSAQEVLKSGSTDATQSSTPTNTRTVQRSNTRRSYTPSYSKPEDNSRPTYNRASYTRVSSGSRPTQTTGTVQSTNTGTRQVQSTATIPRSSTVTTPRSSSSSSTVRPSATRSRSTTTYQQGSSSSSPGRSSSGSYSTPSKSNSGSSTRSSGSSSSGSRSVSSGSSSSGSSSSSSSSSSGGTTIRQGRR